MAIRWRKSGIHSAQVADESGATTGKPPFANELVQGAPRIHDALSNDLKTLVDEKVTILTGWMDQGKIARVHPYHWCFRSGP